MTRIAVLGMGAMGSRMALNLLKAGHQLTVWNRTPERLDGMLAAGATAAATPREAAGGADIVISMVRDDDASRAVWLGAGGALDGLSPQAVAVESSTLTIGWVKTLAAAAAERTCAFLDAPVVGSRPQAEAGQLVYLLGGRPDVIEKVQPVLTATGGAFHHVGEAGDATAVKLAVNVLFGVQVTTLAELFGLLRRGGIDLERAVAAIGATAACSPAAKTAAQSMLAQTFAPLFPVELVEKDFGYALAAAGSPDSAPVAKASHRVLRQAIEQGFGADHLTGIVRLY